MEDLWGRFNRQTREKYCEIFNIYVDYILSNDGETRGRNKIIGENRLLIQIYPYHGHGGALLYCI